MSVHRQCEHSRSHTHRNREVDEDEPHYCTETVSASLNVCCRILGLGSSERLESVVCVVCVLKVESKGYHEIFSLDGFGPATSSKQVP